MFAIQRIFSKSSIARAAIAALVAVSMVNISASPANAAGTESRLTNLSKVQRSTIVKYGHVLHSANGNRMLAVGPYLNPATSTDGGTTWNSVDGPLREWDLLAGSSDLGVSLASELIGRTQENGYQPTGSRLYLSQNFGQTFVNVTPTDTSTIWTAIAVSSSGGQIFAATSNELYWSNDLGASWSSIILGPVEVPDEANDTFRALSMVIGPESENNLADEVLIGFSNGQVQQFVGFATYVPGESEPNLAATTQALMQTPEYYEFNDVVHLAARTGGLNFTHVFASSATYADLKIISIGDAGLIGPATSDLFNGSITGMLLVNNGNLLLTTDGASYLISAAGTDERAETTLDIPGLHWRVISSSASLGVTNGSLFLQTEQGETYTSTTGIANLAADYRLPKAGVVKTVNSNHGIYTITANGSFVLLSEFGDWLIDEYLAADGVNWKKLAVSENREYVVTASWLGALGIKSSTATTVFPQTMYPLWSEPKFLGISDDGQTVVVVGTEYVDGQQEDKIAVSSDGGTNFDRIESGRAGANYTDMHFDGSSNNLYLTSSEYGLELFEGSNSWGASVLASGSQLVFEKFTVSADEQQIIAGVNQGGAYYITEPSPDLISGLGNHVWNDFEIGTIGDQTWTVAASADGQMQFQDGLDGTWKTVVSGVSVEAVTVGDTFTFLSRENSGSQELELYLADPGWSLESVAGSFYPDNVWDSNKFKFGLYDDDNEINNFSHFTRVDGYTNQSSQYLCQTLGVSPCTVEQLAAADTNLQGKLTLPTCTTDDQVMCLADVQIYETGTARTSATLDPTFDVGTPTFPAQPEYGLPAGGKTSVWTSTREHQGGSGSQESDGTQYAVNATVTFHWNKEAERVYFSTMVASVTPFNDLDSPGYKANSVEQFDRDGIPTVGYSMTVDPGRCVIVKTDYCGRIQDFAENTQVELSVRVPNEIGGWYKGRMVDPAISTSVFDGAPGNQVITVSAEHAFVPRLQVDMDADLFTQTLLDRNQEDTAYGLNASNGGGIGIAASNEWSVNVIKALLQSPEVIPNKANGFNTVWSFGTLSSDIAIDTCAATAGTSVLGIIATDAMAYSDRGPILNPTSGTLDYQVAGAHFKADGTTVVQGNYQMTLNLALAKCQWGLTDAELSPTALTNAVSVVDANGTPKTGVTTSVAIDENWLTFKASGFTFSEPKIKVQLKPATVNSSGDSTPVATPTPTPSVTPTPAAEAKPAPLKVPASMKLGTTTKVAIPAAAKAIAGVKVTVRQSAATKKICVATPVISGGKVVAVKIKALKKSLVGCAFMLNTTVPDSNTKFESSSERYVVPIK